MKTKKQILTTLVILLMARLANAQLQIGAIAGISGTTQSTLGDIYDNDDISIGFNPGITLRKQVNETFALKVNFQYAQKGRSYELKEENQYIKYTDKFNYLILPLKAEYSIPVLTNRLFLAGGPYAGLLLDAKQKTGDVTMDLNNETKKTDFGLSFELGFGKKCFSKNELQFSISYDLGLTKITDYDEDLRNKSLSFNLGYLF